MKILLVTFITVLISGCAYPVYKTLQPSAKASITDINGKPIAGAEVSLIANSFPYGFEKSRVSQLTNVSGEVRFKSDKGWRIENLMIHGIEVFFWNWCAKKDGYETFVTTHRSSRDFKIKKNIALKPGESTSCPKDVYLNAL